MSIVREKLIEAGVGNLKEFGYPAVNAENILTDYVYSEFFKKMLEDTVEEAGEMPVADDAKALLDEIEEFAQELRGTA